MPQPEPVSEDRQSQNRHPRQRLEPRTPTAIPAAANGLLNSCSLSPATVMSSQGMAVKDWRISTHHNRTEMIHRERATERPAQPNPGRSWRSPPVEDVLLFMNVVPFVERQVLPAALANGG